MNAPTMSKRRPALPWLLPLLLFFLVAAQSQAQVPAGYRIETVELPKGAVTILGLCHKPDGTLAVVSWEGEVWEYRDETWTRFAENLMEPNGIYYDAKEDAYYVAQKPELTRLVDIDKDGTCDKYECITDAFGVSGEYHEYHYGPVVDSLGRKYASLNLAARGEFTVPDGKPAGKGGGNMSYNAPWRGWVYRSDRPGHFQPLANGFRSPCGIGMSPNDELFITDNQGDWVADCCLYHVREGNFYGHPASLPARPGFTKEKVLSMTAADFAKLRTPPAVWFPREVIANTPGSPVWDTTGGKFGPFENQIFIGDQRQSNYFRVGVEKVDGDYQGWCVDFLRGLESGPVKMSFDPQGRLWSAQVGRGWFSVGGKRTALQYAEWDGKTVPFAIHSASLTKSGFSVRFTQPIGRKITPSVRSWHYHYYSTYGSPPVDEKKLEVSNYQLSKDRRTVTFDAPLTAGRVYAIQFPEQKNTERAPLDFDTVFYTLNKVRPAKEPGTGRKVGWSLAGSGWNRNDKRRPVPPAVDPLPEKEWHLSPPESATVLDANQWTNAAWTFDEEGVMSRAKGNNSTKEAYGNARIHLEFRFEPSDNPDWTGQLYGNSGVFLMSGYELQVVNSFENPTFADGMCGAIYGQHPPRVNASRIPGEWQSYDILMKAPTFAEDGSVDQPLRATIFHNGILIHDDVWIYGEVGGPYKRHGKRPLMLQDHKGTQVYFRNAWILPDIDYERSLDEFRGNFGNTPAHFVDEEPERPRITVLPENLVRMMDENGDVKITEQEFLGFWSAQFDPADENRDGLLNLAEFPHEGALKGADGNQDGYLTREEHRDVYRSQFPGLDRDRDGVITAADRKESPPETKRPTTPGKRKNAEDTFVPYRDDGEVPQKVSDLWKNYDARKEPLETRVVKEWKSDGIVTRYVTFEVGTFKGAKARIAAYYSFPDNGKKNAAFVWSHGGGQRAERGRGVYFAKQGFATLDINWLGRPMEDDIQENTDWGKVDPTQGPRFYAKALRKGWKRDLQPDEYSIDPVASPRNANWFLLTVAARRAITFLEQQPEVDPERIGFSGFSMGGMITALTAIDSRLKAVAPFVGGTGFKYDDFPGPIEGSGIGGHFQKLDLYQNTIDASSYWPLVECPVMFITSSNDFNSTFERIYQSMALLNHQNWRVAANIHQNHGPDPEQWVLLNLWFDQYLKGIENDIPVSPPSTFEVKGGKARFSVTPPQQDRLVETEIYFSYDPNSRTRFWHRADAAVSGKSWGAEMAVHEELPLHVFALCRYRLPETRALERGETATFTLNSLEHVHLPETVDLDALDRLPKTGEIFEDFENGIRDWSSRDGRTIQTYKFQSPSLDVSNDRKLAIAIDPAGRKLTLRLKVGSRFLSREDNLGDFSFTRQIEGPGPQEILIARNEFENADGKTLEWDKIATFSVALIDQETKVPLNLTSEEGRDFLQRIELVDPVE